MRSLSLLLLLPLLLTPATTPANSALAALLATSTTADQQPRGTTQPAPASTQPATAPATPATSPADPATAFQHAFQAATTATARRDLVMKACDDGLINSHLSLADLQKLFCPSPMFSVFPADKETGTRSAVLYFAPPEPPPTTSVTAAPDQVPHRQWYLWFQFEHGNLRLYYLTNYGK